MRRMLLISVAALLAAALFGTAPAAATRSRASIGSQVVGGNLADAAQFPFAVGLFRHNGSWFCGGTIISTRWVMTAAHCATAPGVSVGIDVVQGVSNLNAVTAADRRQVAQVVVHPNYNENSLRADIALLKLAQPVPSAWVMKPNFDPGGPVLGRSLTLFGWGSTVGINGPYDMRFRTAVLTDKAGTGGACGRWGSLYSAGRNLCAGGPGLASCNGDSGGPVVNYKAAGPVVVGIVSFGLNSDTCVNRGYPSVFTRVSTYRQFITTWTAGT